MEPFSGSDGARALLAAAAGNSLAAETPLGGPSSPVLDVIFCLTPVAFLLVVTLSKRLVRKAWEGLYTTSCFCHWRCPRTRTFTLPIAAAVHADGPQPALRCRHDVGGQDVLDRRGGCWPAAAACKYGCAARQQPAGQLPPPKPAILSLLRRTPSTSRRRSCRARCWPSRRWPSCSAPLCSSTACKSPRWASRLAWGTGCCPRRQPHSCRFQCIASTIIRFAPPCPTTQTMPYIAAVVRATCCGHPVAEVMLVLWALGHLIEGASGFGTGPATLTREPLLARVAAATAGMRAPFHPQPLYLLLLSSPLLPHLQPSWQRWAIRPSSPSCACSS